MAIQMNIGEAKTHLSELVAATERGEDVVLARAGRPTVKFVRVHSVLADEDIIVARRKFMGSLKGMISADVDWSEPAFTDAELDSFEDAL